MWKGILRRKNILTNHTNEIQNEFTFKNIDSLKNNPFYKDIKGSNSVCICVRQNRFSERKRAITKKDDENSLIFTKDQINYIKKAIDIIKTKVSRSKIFFMVKRS